MAVEGMGMLLKNPSNSDGPLPPALTCLGPAPCTRRKGGGGGWWWKKR